MLEAAATVLPVAGSMIWASILDRARTTARRGRVTGLEQNESWTAVSGLSGDAPVVQYATRALNADGGPVRLWEGTA